MTIRAEPQNLQSSATALPKANRGLIVRAAKALVVYWQNRQNRRSLSRMLEMDDYMLKDMGVTRYDVTSALASPAKVDPSARLKQLAVERHRARHRMGSYDFQRWLAPTQP